MNSSYPRQKSRKAARAFTLIELLTVIAIIGILASILIPVVGRVRDSAHSAKSVANLRQLAQANRLHANDHKGLFVPPVATNLAGNGSNPAQWYNNPRFVAYIANESLNGWAATDTVLHSGKPSAWAAGGPSLALSFGGNGGPERNVSFKDSDVDSKYQRMVLFGDSANLLIWGDRAVQSDEVYLDDPGTNTQFGRVAFRPNGKGHFALANGAIIKATKDEMTNADVLGSIGRCEAMPPRWLELIRHPIEGARWIIHDRQQNASATAGSLMRRPGPLS